MREVTESDRHCQLRPSATLHNLLMGDEMSTEESCEISA